MGDPDPGAVEDLFQVGLEQRRVVVQRDVDAIVLDQLVEAFRFGNQPVFMGTHGALLKALFLLASRDALLQLCAEGTHPFVLALAADNL